MCRLLHACDSLTIQRSCHTGYPDFVCRIARRLNSASNAADSQRHCEPAAAAGSRARCHLSSRIAAGVSRPCHAEPTQRRVRKPACDSHRSARFDCSACGRPNRGVGSWLWSRHIASAVHVVASLVMVSIGPHHQRRSQAAAGRRSWWARAPLAASPRCSSRGRALLSRCARGVSC